MIFVGDDWAEDHHDVHVMDSGRDRAGRPPAAGRLARISRRHQLLAEHAGDLITDDPGQVVIGIEARRDTSLKTLRRTEH